MSTLPHEAPTGSLLDAIRRQQRDSALGKTIDIPIAGYRHPELVVRYRFLDHDESLAIGDRIRGNDDIKTDIERAETALITTMIEACEGVFAREGDKLEPVQPDDGGGPCRFDDRLEIFFGREPSGSARQSVLVAFKDNWLAAVNHARTLAEWFGDTSKTIDKLLGEA